MVVFEFWKLLGKICFFRYNLQQFEVCQFDRKLSRFYSIDTQKERAEIIGNRSLKICQKRIIFLLLFHLTVTAKD